MVEDLVDLVEFSNDELSKLRQHLKSCWISTYQDELGSSITKKLIQTLEDPTLGGLLPRRGEKAYVVKSGGHVVGCIVWEPRNGTVYLWGCYIQPLFRRRGIGSQLVKTAINEAEADAVASVIVLKSSEKAQLFYKSMGFNEVENIQFELIPGQFFPAIEMRASLEDLKGNKNGSFL